MFQAIDDDRRKNDDHAFSWQRLLQAIDDYRHEIAQRLLQAIEDDRHEDNGHAFSRQRLLQAMVAITRTRMIPMTLLQVDALRTDPSHTNVSHIGAA